MDEERWTLLEQLDELADPVLNVLALVWLGLLIVEFTRGLNPLLETTTYIFIWALFIVDLVVELIITPQWNTYRRRHWFKAISLALPFLRGLHFVQGLRLLRPVSALRSVGLVRLLASVNQSMRALRRTLSQQGIKDVLALTTLVTFAGAVEMYYCENLAFLQTAGLAGTVQSGAGLDSYGEAVWWISMLLTTLGSEYWPKTAEGTIVTFLLSVYAFAIAGYITATIASYSIGRVPETRPFESGGQDTSASDMTTLRDEIRWLRSQVSELSSKLDARGAHRQLSGDDINGHS